MKLKLICCDVLSKEIEYITKKYDIQVESIYSKKAEHEKPDKLRTLIQDEIDSSDDHDVILLGYGLCGNSLDGIRSGKKTLVIPRAHDCCSLFLGSRHRFNELFQDRESMQWGSTGYCRIEGDYLRTSDTGSVIGYDRTYDEYVEEYGKDNADFIWQTIHPEHESNDVLFINNPETYDDTVYRQFAKEAGSGKNIIMEAGDLGLLEKFITSEWDGDFLVVPPGETIQAVYDRNEVVRSICCNK